MIFYDATEKIKTQEQKFNYLKEHYTYYTLNSWNGSKSIANNVKVHYLPLTEEQCNRFWELYSNEELCEQLYDYINNILHNFEISNGYRVGFNGRSDGYLVLYNKNNSTNILNEYIEDANSYKEAINNYKNDYNTITKEARANIDYLINNDFNIVQAFDRLCDDILSELINILDNATIEEEAEQITINHKVLIF